ncbi:hypothetical protein DRP07_08000 [Archaeoglobales archaeon]|nr:MAG: hypothetical protein DRP07_08000 [Archaeoglobales archaeon]
MVEYTVLKSNRLKERIDFVRYYAKWVNSVQNRVWSMQQAKLINSFMENSKNFKFSAEDYLKMKSIKNKIKF